jgi:hypothetical protein
LNQGNGLENKGKRYSNQDQIPLTKEELFKENLTNNIYAYTKGWVLVDFP